MLSMTQSTAAKAGSWEERCQGGFAWGLNIPASLRRMVTGLCKNDWYMRKYTVARLCNSDLPQTQFLCCVICVVTGQLVNSGQESLSFSVHLVSQKNELNWMMGKDICNSTMDLQVYAFLSSQPPPQTAPV